MGMKSFAGLALAIALMGFAPVEVYAQTAPDTPSDTTTAPVKKMVKPKKVAPKMDDATTTDAATKPVKPKPKGSPTVLVTVSNQRSVGVVEVDAAIAGGPESKKIAGAVAPGKKAVVKVAHDKDCLFDIHASFEDGATSDASGVNLCKEKKLNFVE